MFQPGGVKYQTRQFRIEVHSLVVQTTEMKRTMPMILQWDESFDIGSDMLTGVNNADYKPPFPLTAQLNKHHHNRSTAAFTCSERWKEKTIRWYLAELYLSLSDGKHSHWKRKIQ